jgi:hypothetical protein
MCDGFPERLFANEFNNCREEDQGARSQNLANARQGSILADR